MTATVPGVWNPWHALRDHPDLTLAWTTRLPDGTLGLTDGTTIWLTTDQTQAEARCTLTHELIHVERCHTGHQPRTVERAVETETARRLIPLPDLVRALAWAASATEAAEDLWVDQTTLTTRLDTLTQSERAALRARLGNRPW